MTIRLLAVLCALLSLGGVATAAEPERLAPTSPWNLRFDDEACRLVRTFGTGDGAVTLIFAKYAPGMQMDVILSGKTIRPDRGAKFSYRFALVGEFETAPTALFGDDPAKGAAWQLRTSLVPSSERKLDDDWRNPPDPAARRAREQARAAEIDALEVRSGMERPIALATGPLDRPFAGLDLCLDDLVESWGFDPAVQNALAARPRPKSNPSGWFSWGDYPRAMLERSLSSAVRIRLHVAPNGMPTKCVVQDASSDPAFEKLSCAILMKKARFEPARDAAGTAVESYWATSIVWIV